MDIIRAIELLNEAAKKTESRYGKAAGSIVINDAVIKGTLLVAEILNKQVAAED